MITGKSTEQGMYEELEEYVTMVFDQPETAKSYCRKLYRYYIKSEWDSEVETDIITPLAQQLIDNNFEILPVVKTLLSSRHFYDEDDSDATDNLMGAIVKSPLQLFSEVVSMFSLVLPNPTTETDDYYRLFFQKFVHSNNTRLSEKHTLFIYLHFKHFKFKIQFQPFLDIYHFFQV